MTIPCFSEFRHYAAARRRKLVAQATVHADAFDVLALAEVNTGISKPSGIRDLSGDTQRILPKGPHPRSTKLLGELTWPRIDCAVRVLGWNIAQRCVGRTGITREFMKHAGHAIGNQS